MASGEDFPDALVASSLAGAWKTPMLLGQRECVSIAATDFLRSRGIKDVTLIGGTAVLSDDGAGQLRLCG